MTERVSVLVCTDFEEASNAAVVEAQSLARDLGGDLWMVHVALEEPPIGTTDETSPASMEHAEAALTAWAAHAGATRAILRRGDPPAELLAAIDELRPTVTVMSTHARKGVARLVLGSVTETVLRKSSSPVVSVNPLAAETVTHPERSPAGEPVILVPMDFDELSERAFVVADELGRRIGCRLALLHVTPAPVPEMGGGYLAAVEADREEAERFLGGRGEFMTLVRAGDPAAQILATAAELRPRFVVMGTHRRTALARATLGSVTDRVVREGAAPVITVSEPLRAARAAA